MLQNKFHQVIAILRKDERYLLFACFLAAFLVFATLAIVWQQPVLLLVPFGLFAIYLAIVDLQALYLLMWAAIPLSTELYLPNGLGTDFPDEALMLLLAGAGLLYLLARLPVLKTRMLFHPVSLLLMLHYGWIWVTTLQSDMFVVSFKFALAKSWYLLVFFILTYLFIRRESMRRKWFLAVMLPLGLTITVIFIRHLGMQLSFDSINDVVGPFYRNHVTYAAFIAVFAPFLWYSRMFLPGRINPWTWALIVLATGIALYFTYTRAAYLAVLFAAGWYVIMRFRLTQYAIVGSLLGAAVFLVVMTKNNRYIDFEPDYAKTITHHKFEHLIEATYKFEDISTMERFYRWIAGYYMLREAPLMGFGPGNFYNFYKSFTDENFVTYVSDNPEKSGTHNYYLMTATDQGIPGLFIFLALCFAALVRGERLFHAIKDKRSRAFIVACILSLVIILFLQLFNDLIETDKIGSFFFFILAAIVALDVQINEQNQLKSGD